MASNTSCSQREWVSPLNRMVPIPSPTMREWILRRTSAFLLSILARFTYTLANVSLHLLSITQLLLTIYCFINREWAGSLGQPLDRSSRCCLCQGRKTMLVGGVRLPCACFFRSPLAADCVEDKGHCRWYFLAIWWQSFFRSLTGWWIHYLPWNC